MAEYIKREDAYTAAGLIALASVDRKITCGEVQKIMNSIPNADVVERRKGRWELNAPDDFIVYCSECMMPQDSPCNFCPSCGADMRGET